MTRTAAQAVECILRVMADTIVSKALSLVSGDEKKTISTNDLEVATQMVVRDSEFQDILTEFARARVQEFTNSELERQGHQVEKAQTRESRCGLVFSVSACEKYVRRFGQIAYHVSAGSPVYLASVLEQITRRLLEKTVVVTENAKKITVTVRHLFLAISQDPAMDFVSDTGVVFLEAGVEPQNLQTKQHKRIKRRKATTPETDSQKPHRWRPGTKTVMEIRKMQKSGDLLMQRTPFNRVVREIVSTIHTRDYKIRYTADFFLSLQAFVEDRTVDLMKRANLLSAHANRETVFEKDIVLACELNGESYKIPVPIESYIPGAALRKMALRAGIKRFGDGSSVAYRNYIVGLLRSCLTDITLCAYHHKVQTLNTRIFSESMAMRGVFPSIIPRKRKVGRKGSSSTVSASAVEDTQSRLEPPMLSDIEEEQEEEMA